MLTAMVTAICITGLQAPKPAPLPVLTTQKIVSEAFYRQRDCFYTHPKDAAKCVRNVLGAVATLSPEKIINSLWETKSILIGDAFSILTGDYLDIQPEFVFGAIPVISANGMGNDRRDSEAMMRETGNAFGGELVTRIANNTHWGGLGDYIQAVGHELFGAYDKPTRNMAAAIKKAIDDKGVVYVVAHSQGTAYFKMALRMLSKEDKAKIHYYGAGSEWFIDAEKEGLASARNVWNKGDKVPAGANSFINPTNILNPSHSDRTSRNRMENGFGRTSWETIDQDRTNENQPTNRHHFITYYSGDMQKWAAAILTGRILGQ